MELIVSVAITSILMLGLSVFFSSTFHNLFQAETQQKNLGHQFAVNEIIRTKFNALDDLVENNGDSVLSLNKRTKYQLPFSFIGTATIDEDMRLVFKDTMLFTKIINPGAGSHLFGDMVTGQPDGAIKEASTGNPVKSLADIKNFAGFTKVGDDYYVAIPGENRVLHCPSAGGCTELSFNPALLSPTDVEKSTDDKFLFISDSGNGRVIPYEIGVGEKPPLVTGLNYPTGLTYYKKGVKEYLFIAETFNHRIRKYDFSTFLAPVAVGDGNDADCDKTAQFCQLNLPTGLYADIDNNALFIADSGNNRVLKMSDPEPLMEEATDLALNFELNKSYAWSKIVLSSVFTGGAYESGNLPSANYSAAEHRFENYVPPTLAHSHEECDLTNKLYTTDSLFDNGIRKDDFLVINDTTYQLINDPSHTKFDCDPAEDIEDWAYPAEISPTPNGDIENGDIVYLGTPPIVNVTLSGAKMDAGGFQTIQIDTYSVKNQMVPAETDYATVRVGDGVLGTPEDKMQVIAGNEGGMGFVVDDLGNKKMASKVIFPTGVTNGYFANGGGKKIVQFSNGNEVDFDPIDVSAFTVFDYVSDFIVKTLTFASLNGGKILEMVLEANIDDMNTQTYQINAVLP
ncbi:hypothetical protein JW752_00015 [Candidatus Peregrinibacteria bacterium]|nr:hypothetical protein [Candidatus Peregrinibacteria bacterium]